MTTKRSKNTVRVVDRVAITNDDMNITYRDTEDQYLKLQNVVKSLDDKSISEADRNRLLNCLGSVQRITAITFQNNFHNIQGTLASDNQPENVIKFGDDLQ